MQYPGFMTIYWRDMLRFVRFKTLLFSSLIQPALWMAFFGIAMSSSFDRFTAASPPIPGVPAISYLTFMAAGVIAMTTLFTSFYGGIVLLFDKNWGLMREILASPLPRDDLILGVGLSGVTKSFIQAALIMLFGFALGVGFFPGQGPGGILLSLAGIFAFIAIFSLGFLFLSAAISISLESPEGLQGIITLLTMPLFFVSNALYPIGAFPPVLQALSAWNPLTHLITGIRFFAIGDRFSATGILYPAGAGEVATSFIALLAFTMLTFLVARWRVRVAVVT